MEKPLSNGFERWHRFRSGILDANPVSFFYPNGLKPPIKMGISGILPIKNQIFYRESGKKGCPKCKDGNSFNAHSNLLKFDFHDFANPKNSKHLAHHTAKQNFGSDWIVEEKKHIITIDDKNKKANKNGQKR